MVCQTLDYMTIYCQASTSQLFLSALSATHVAPPSDKDCPKSRTFQTAEQKATKCIAALDARGFHLKKN